MANRNMVRAMPSSSPWLATCAISATIMRLGSSRLSQPSVKSRTEPSPPWRAPATESRATDCPTSCARPSSFRRRSRTRRGAQDASTRITSATSATPNRISTTSIRCRRNCPSSSSCSCRRHPKSIALPYRRPCSRPWLRICSKPDSNTSIMWSTKLR